MLDRSEVCCTGVVRFSTFATKSAHSCPGRVRRHVRSWRKPTPHFQGVSVGQPTEPCLVVLPVVIPANEAFSNGVDCSAGRIFQLILPDAWSGGAVLTFQISEDGET